MHYYLLLLTLISHFTRTSTDFILTRKEYNTVTLFCQLISTGESFNSIIPGITWGDSDRKFEFIDIRDQMNDDRYFGSHFPDPKAKNLVGDVVIRDFRESDLQNNFKCTQSLINGTRIEYALTIANDTATLPTASSTYTTSHSYSRNKTRGMTNTTHPGTMYIPPCTQNTLHIDVYIPLILLSFITSCLFMTLLALVVILRSEIKEKFFCRKPSIPKRRQTNVHRVGYYISSNTVNVATDSDTHSARSSSHSSQEYYSFQADDLSEPVILDNDSSTEPPVKGLVNLKSIDSLS